MSRVDSRQHEDADIEPGPLEVLFSGPARTRVIEAFVSERGRDLSVSDVARLSETSRSSVYRHLEDLQDLGLIEVSRETGDGYSTRYQLAEDSAVAERLCQLEGVMLRHLIEDEGKL